MPFDIFATPPYPGGTGLSGPGDYQAGPGDDARVCITDRAVAGALLLLLLPLLLVSVTAVLATSRGPALTHLTIVTRSGRLRRLPCLRTTYDPGTGSCRQITRVGHVLRLGRIDTMPALACVALGQIGLAETLGR